MIHRRRSVLALVTLAAIQMLPLAAAHGQNLNEVVGFTPHHVLGSDAFGEYIDHQNGALNLSIPIGPRFRVGPRLSYQLQLSYTSLIWRVRPGDGGNPELIREGPFGVGFFLHLGRIEPPRWGGASSWEYVSPDGSRHPIGFHLVTGEQATVDGTYILAEKEGADPNFPDGWTLHFPDGTIGHFSPEDWPGAPVNHFRVDSLSGPDQVAAGQPAAELQVQYSQTTDEWRCINQITDSIGRVITFTNTPTSNGGLTTAIELPSFPGSSWPAKWEFTYDSNQTLTSPHSSDPTDPTVPFSGRDLLRTIMFPGPSQGQAGFNERAVLEFRYEDPATGTVTDGMMRKRYPPHPADPSWDPSTDPHYEYVYDLHTYRAWGFDLDSWELEFHDSRVVVSKILHNLDQDPSTTDQHSWNWTRVYDALGNATGVEVEDPDQNVMRYEFESDPGTGQDWRSGLLIRTQWFAGADPATRKLLREETRDYALGQFRADYGSPLGDIHVTSTATLLESSVGFVLVEQKRVGLDDYGRPSDVITEAPGRGLYRREHAAWNTPGPTDPWILGSWTSRVRYDDLGRPVSRADAAFGPTGLLLAAWQRIDPTGTPSALDIHMMHEYDVDTDPDGYGWGLRTKTTITGGDPGGHDYVTGFEYHDNTYLARTRVLPSGDMFAALSASWFATNRDFDPHTGLLIRSLDPNDEEGSSAGPPGHPGATDASFQWDTTYEWDELGRLVTIHPPNDEAPTEITYDTLRRTRLQRCATPGTDCRTSIFKHDPFGRVVEERQSDKDGNFNGRQTTYDWAGRVVARTEWFACDEPITDDCAPEPPATLAETQFDYTINSSTLTDPFGRPWKVTAADGAETTFTYTETMRTATTEVDGALSTTRWFYDAFGRLVAVDAPDGADASYIYDSSDRVIRAELVDPVSGASQVRSFVYDTLGRLRSSTTPEGGTVQVLAYDARGKPFHTRDSKRREFWTTYDDAGRVLDVMDATAGRNVVLSRNQYDGYGWETAKKGRLIKTETFDQWGVPVVETEYIYSVDTLRLQTLAQLFAAWMGRTDEYDMDPTVLIDYSYDAWGEISVIGYPNPYSETRQTNQIAQLVYARTNGWLTNVSDSSREASPGVPTPLLTVDSYNAAGAAERWTAGNGVVTDFSTDVRFRPQRITVAAPGGGPPLWDSGDYAYDDAGNILRMERSPTDYDEFDYDVLGRLTRASISFDDGTGLASYIEQYAYDAFGNLTSKIGSGAQSGTLNLDVDAQTNRINHATSPEYEFSWDPSGNLVEDPTLFDPPPPGSPSTLDLGVLQFDGRGRLAGIAKRPQIWDVSAGSWADGVGWWEEQFAYDASGLRVARTDAETGLTTFYVRDISGQVLSEFVRPTDSELTPAWSRDTFYALGGTLAVAEAGTPGPPTGLYATVSPSGGDHQVTLNWKAVEGADDYTVYKTNQAVTGEPVPTAYGYQWSEIVPAGVYFYEVASVAGGVDGLRSRMLTVNPGGSSPPAVDEASFHTEVLNATIRLEWDRVPDFDVMIAEDFYEYRVERQEPFGSWEVLTEVPLREPFFVDPDPRAVPFGSNLQYRVYAVDTSGNEDPNPPTEVASIPPDPYRPSPPGGLFGSPGPDQLEASIGWEASTDDDVLLYYVYENNAGVWNVVGATTETTFTLPELQEGVPVTLAVTAADFEGESPKSEPITVWPAVSTATLPPPTGVSAGTRSSASALVHADGPAHFYRRLEGAANVATLRNGTPTLSLADRDLRRCRGYVYVATASGTQNLDGVLVSTGDESGVSPKFWMPRYVAPTKPTLESWGNNQITLSWDGTLTECVEDGSFVISKFWFMTYDATQGSVELSIPLTSADYDASFTFDFTGSSPVWIEAEITPMAGEDPAEVQGYGPTRTNGPQDDQWFCANGALGEVDPGECAYDPGPAGGGPPPDEPELPPEIRKIVALPEDAFTPWSPTVRLADSVVPFTPRRTHVRTSPSPSPKRDWSGSAYLIVGQAPAVAGSPASRGIALAYLHSDHLGTTRLTTTETAIPLRHGASMPFGEILSSEPGSADRFAGHVRDAGDGFLYMMARYASPALGRFISADPLAGAIEAPRSLNRFPYAANSPVRYVDPLGQQAFAPFVDTCYTCGVTISGHKRQERAHKAAAARVLAHETLDSPNVSISDDMRTALEVAINNDPAFATSFSELGKQLTPSRQLRISYQDVAMLVESGVLKQQENVQPSKAWGAVFITQQDGVQTMHVVANSNEEAGVTDNVLRAAAISHELVHAHGKANAGWVNKAYDQIEEDQADLAAYWTIRRILAGEAMTWREVDKGLFRRHLRRTSPVQLMERIKRFSN